MSDKKSQDDGYIDGLTGMNSTSGDYGFYHLGKASRDVWAPKNTHQSSAGNHTGEALGHLIYALYEYYSEKKRKYNLIKDDPSKLRDYNIRKTSSRSAIWLATGSLNILPIFYSLLYISKRGVTNDVLALLLITCLPLSCCAYAFAKNRETNKNLKNNFSQIANDAATAEKIKINNSLQSKQLLNNLILTNVTAFGAIASLLFIINSGGPQWLKGFSLCLTAATAFKNIVDFKHYRRNLLPEPKIETPNVYSVTPSTHNYTL